LDVADTVLIGGGMCFSFFKATGHQIGNSLCEDDQVDVCKALLDEFGDRLQLPEDVVGLGPGGEIGKPDAGGEVRNFGRAVPDGWMGLDIGPGTAAAFGDLILSARTILWNGPMGVFEDPRFEAGTRSVASAVAESRGFSVIGGGDSAAAIAQFGMSGDVSHISTGGGASLELIEQGDLPGLDALRRASNADGV
jgi:phosphoglycerate kinase